MTHNSLSRQVAAMPMWLIQAIIGLILTGMVSWGTWATAQVYTQANRVSVAEEKVDNIREDIKDIKDSQKDTNRKLDRLLERRGR